jgi:hypothetical protein
LSKFDPSGTTANIKGRNNRNLEPGQHQYICPWNCDLHIYTNISGPLRNSGFFKHYNREQHLTNFYNNSKFILSECHSPGAAAYVERRN